MIAGLLVPIAAAVLLEVAREAMALEEANARRLHRYIHDETDLAAALSPRRRTGPCPNP